MRTFDFVKNILHAPAIIWGLDIINELRSRIILDTRKTEPALIRIRTSGKK